MPQDCLNQAVGIFEDNRDTAIEYKELSEISETSSEYLANEVDDAEARVDSLEGFLGTWVGTTTYQEGQMVGYDGELYIAKQLTYNATPDVSPKSWKLYGISFIRDNYFGKTTIVNIPFKNSLTPIEGTSVTFERSSTATYIDRYGVVQTASVDEPRFEKEGLLLEGASENEILYSEELDNAEWDEYYCSMLPNNTTAPDGTTTADTLEDTTDNEVHSIQQASIQYTSGVEKTLSFFVKAGTMDKVVFTFMGGYSGGWSQTTFDLSTKTFDGDGGGLILASRKYKELANGWFRIEATMLPDTTETSPIRIVPHNGTTITYAGTGAETLHIWGVQIEDMPFATSYIPTTTTSVTRSKDKVTIPYTEHTPLWKYAHSISIDLKPLSVEYDVANRFVLTTGNLSNGYINLSKIGAVSYAVIGSNTVIASYVTATEIESFVFVSDGANITKGYANGILSSDIEIIGDNEQDNDNVITIGMDGDENQQFNGHLSNLKIFSEALRNQTAKGI